MRAYEDDSQCRILRKIIANPLLVRNKNLRNVHFTFHAPLRKRCMVMENGFIILIEPNQNQNTLTKLIVVPKDLCNIIFISFHANPTGGHLGLYQTAARIFLRHTWPELFKYFKQ